MIFWSRVILKMQASFKKILLRLLNVCFMYMHTVQGHLPTYIKKSMQNPYLWLDIKGYQLQIFIAKIIC